MKKNMGAADRIIRAIIAVIIVLLYTSGKIQDTTAIIILIIAGIFLLTSLVSFCPLYTLLSIKTNKNDTRN